MGEPISALAEDLEKKFKDLCLMHDLPAIYLSEYFFEQRNRIDIDAEQLLLETDRNDSSKPKRKPSEGTVRVNGLRESFIRILKKMEDDLLEKLPASLPNTSAQVYASLGQRIDEFRKSLGNERSLREHEEAYILLADEIFYQTSQLEVQLFRNQTIAYVNLGVELGKLVYVQYGHLNKTELEALM